MPAIIAFVGPSNSGKTALISRLVQVLQGRGYRVAAAKHTHHEFEVDRAGKDSHQFQEAGAAAVLLSSSRRYAVIRRVDREVTLERLVGEHLATVDLVLAEGFRRSRVPKIQVGARISPPPEGEVIAEIGDCPGSEVQKVFSPEEVRRIADLIEDRFLT